MSTCTTTEIAQWFTRGKEETYSHMLVCSDTFSYEYYPAYASTLEEAKSKYKAIMKEPYNNVMEVYNLNEDMQEQVYFSPAGKRVMRW